MNSLYEHLGGPNRVRRVLEDFEQRTWKDDQLRVFFVHQRLSFFKIHQWNLVKYALREATIETEEAISDELLANIFHRHSKLFAPQEDKSEAHKDSNQDLQQQQQQQPQEEQGTTEASSSTKPQQPQQQQPYLGVEQCDRMLLHLVHALQASNVPQDMVDRAVVTLAKVREIFVLGNHYQPSVVVAPATQLSPKSHAGHEAKPSLEPLSTSSSSSTSATTSPKPPLSSTGRTSRSGSVDSEEETAVFAVDPSNNNPLQTPPPNHRRRTGLRESFLLKSPSFLRKSAGALLDLRCGLSPKDPLTGGSQRNRRGDHIDDDDDDDDDKDLTNLEIFNELSSSLSPMPLTPNDSHSNNGLDGSNHGNVRRSSLLKSPSFLRKSVRLMTKAM